MTLALARPEQMCYEDDLTAITGAPINPVTTISGNAYALGARGIDMIRPFTVDTSTFARTYYAAQFPIYDGHGNLKCTLTRSGSSPWYTISNSRSYDVWGGARDGSASGDPNTRYCANLGHKQDDESGLIYMRARYYEPGTGRFVSEDPARDGLNWFVYCGNEPIGRIDPSGRASLLEFTGILLLSLGAIMCAGAAIFASSALTPSDMIKASMLALQAITVVGLGASILSYDATTSAILGIGLTISSSILASTFTSLLIRNVGMMVANGAVVGKTLARNASVGLLCHAFITLGFIASIEFDSWVP